MSSPAHRLELEAAERRLLDQLKVTPPSRPSARRAAVVVASLVLFALTFTARLTIPDPNALIANFYVIPVVLLAIEFGARVGVLAAVAGMGLVLAWSAINTVDVTLLGYCSRAAPLLLAGAVVGSFSDRLRADIAERHQVQRRLALYTDELERANQHLGRSVERLDAFAQIARAVGGETDLERVLFLILAQGREIIRARELIIYLPRGDELVAVSERAGRGRPQSGLPFVGSAAGEVLLTGHPLRVGPDEYPRQFKQATPPTGTAILVPLVFRGESLGVLAGIYAPDAHPIAAEDEQLLMSVAASAATALETARSVAAARLRLSLEAAEQARARWARELHDETLQGLSGVRMVLSAGLARDDLPALRDAAHAADAHLGEEMRNLRNLIAELRPAALDDLGLGPAIETLANGQASMGGFAVTVSLALDPHQRLARDTETVTYRIVQEALSNIVKHADAEHVNLLVQQFRDRVEVKVDDDGRGFDPDAVHAGFGLVGMRERALLVGGSLSVSSSGPGATSVSAVLPVAA